MTQLAEIQQRVADLELRQPPRRQATFDTVELREDDDGKIVFVGHAAVFDRLSDDLGGFRERIQRGAFRKVLDADADVRFLFNHNADNILARTSSGTMELREDPKGLRVYAELAPTTLGRDLKVLVQRGDVSQMSFAFRVYPDGKDVWQEEDGELIRTIVSFSDLLDVGAVTYPAYPQTDAGIRSQVCGIAILSEAGELLEAPLRDLSWKIHRGDLVATADERATIDAALEQLDTVSPWVAQRALRAVSQEPELQGVIPGKRAAVVLEDTPDAGEPPWRRAARERSLALRAHTLR